MPVAYQRQVLEPGDLVLLPRDAEEGARDLVVLGDGRVRDGLRQREVRVGVGRLDERAHERLGGPRGLGARRARGDVDRVDDALESVCSRPVLARQMSASLFSAVLVVSSPSGIGDLGSPPALVDFIIVK